MGQFRRVGKRTLAGLGSQSRHMGYGFEVDRWCGWLAGLGSQGKHRLVQWPVHRRQVAWNPPNINCSQVQTQVLNKNNTTSNQRNTSIRINTCPGSVFFGIYLWFLFLFLRHTPGSMNLKFECRYTEAACCVL